MKRDHMSVRLNANIGISLGYKQGKVKCIERRAQKCIFDLPHLSLPLSPSHEPCVWRGESMCRAIARTTFDPSGTLLGEFVVWVCGLIFRSVLRSRMIRNRRDMCKVPTLGMRRRAMVPAIAMRMAATAVPLVPTQFRFCVLSLRRYILSPFVVLSPITPPNLIPP